MAQNFDAVRSRPYAPGYGFDDKGEEGMLTWSWVSGEMEKSRNYWIGTTRPDGNPHVAPVWGVWQDNALYFGSGATSRKGKNIAHNPNIVVHLESGDDTVIMEGTVAVFTDVDVLKPMFPAYAKKYGFDPAEGFDPEKPEGWYVFRAKRVLAWLEKDYPNTATRWMLD